jgi:hypothetical protein
VSPGKFIELRKADDPHAFLCSHIWELIGKCCWGNPSVSLVQTGLIWQLEVLAPRGALHSSGGKIA